MHIGLFFWRQNLKVVNGLYAAIDHSKNHALPATFKNQSNDCL